VSRGKEFDFFADYKHAIDFGSGLGSAELAMTAEGVGFDSMQFIETAHEAVNLHRALIETTGARLSWSTREPSTKDILPETLAIFSYSFTELKQLPKWVEACDGLMIVEPATQEDGRRLMELRQAWINLGWSVVAPCVHQEACPLLVHSGRDWCHDRVAWQRPDWIQAMEDYMPIKNGTLPYSYMLLRRKPLRSHYTQHGFKLARVTGDLQEFKGFAKQLICQSSEREFIAFQKRDFKKAYPNFPRGSLVSIKEGLEKKGHELRPKAEEMTSTILPKP